jgi:hypothetical protein
MSATKLPFPLISLKMPKPTCKEVPVTSPILSVQPGMGSFAAVPIAEGLIKIIGIFF